MYPILHLLTAFVFLWWVCFWGLFVAGSVLTPGESLILQAKAKASHWGSVFTSGHLSVDLGLVLAGFRAGLHLWGGLLPIYGKEVGGGVGAAGGQGNGLPVRYYGGGSAVVLSHATLPRMLASAMALGMEVYLPYLLGLLLCHQWAVGWTACQPSFSTGFAWVGGEGGVSRPLWCGPWSEVGGDSSSAGTPLQGVPPLQGLSLLSLATLSGLSSPFQLQSSGAWTWPTALLLRSLLELGVCVAVVAHWGLVVGFIASQWPWLGAWVGGGSCGKWCGVRGKMEEQEVGGGGEREWERGEREAEGEKEEEEEEEDTGNRSLRRGKHPYHPSHPHHPHPHPPHRARRPIPALLNNSCFNRVRWVWMRLTCLNGGMGLEGSVQGGEGEGHHQHHQHQHYFGAEPILLTLILLWVGFGLAQRVVYPMPPFNPRTAFNLSPRLVATPFYDSGFTSPFLRAASFPLGLLAARWSVGRQASLAAAAGGVVAMNTGGGRAFFTTPQTLTVGRIRTTSGLRFAACLAALTLFACATVFEVGAWEGSTRKGGGVGITPSLSMSLLQTITWALYNPLVSLAGATLCGTLVFSPTTTHTLLSTGAAFPFLLPTLEFFATHALTAALLQPSLMAALCYYSGRVGEEEGGWHWGLLMQLPFKPTFGVPLLLYTILSGGGALGLAALLRKAVRRACALLRLSIPGATIPSAPPFEWPRGGLDVSHPTPPPSPSHLSFAVVAKGVSLAPNLALSINPFLVTTPPLGENSREGEEEGFEEDDLGEEEAQLQEETMLEEEKGEEGIEGERSNPSTHAAAFTILSQLTHEVRSLALLHGGGSTSTVLRNPSRISRKARFPLYTLLPSRTPGGLEGVLLSTFSSPVPPRGGGVSAAAAGAEGCVNDAWVLGALGEACVTKGVEWAEVSGASDDALVGVVTMASDAIRDAAELLEGEGVVNLGGGGVGGEGGGGREHLNFRRQLQGLEEGGGRAGTAVVVPLDTRLEEREGDGGSSSSGLSTAPAPTVNAHALFTILDTAAALLEEELVDKE